LLIVSGLTTVEGVCCEVKEVLLEDEIGHQYPPVELVFELLVG
jgi:hypothetical protein